MADLGELFAHDQPNWLSALPQTERHLCEALLKDHPPEEAAALWLSAAPRDTFPFGGTKKDSKPFTERFKEEVYAFLCGEDKYATDRAKLQEQGKLTYGAVVSGVSVAIAPTLGFAAAVLVPPVALLLLGLGKVTLHAWCEGRPRTSEEAVTPDS